MCKQVPVSAYIALGSNLGARLRHLAAGVSTLRSLAVDGQVNCSAVYETDPVGYLNQSAFLNMVVKIETTLSAHQILASLLDAESSEGRVRTIRNGPRTLDMDLLLYGEEQIDDEALQVPHPRMVLRAFVLCPLADIAPDLVLGDGFKVADLAKQLALEGGIQYVGRFW